MGSTSQTVISPDSTPATHIFYDFAARSDDPNSRQFYDYLIGRIDYEDVFYIKHWRKFCFVAADSKGNLRDCKYGNDEDRNPELPSN
jgi:hypothetical protein